MSAANPVPHLYDKMFLPFPPSFRIRESKRVTPSRRRENGHVGDVFGLAFFALNSLSLGELHPRRACHICHILVAGEHAASAQDCFN